MIVSGLDRSAAASGRGFLLNLADLLTTDPSAALLLKSVNIHLIFDANPSVPDAVCDSVGPQTSVSNVLLDWIEPERFAMVVAIHFHSVGISGSSSYGLKHQLETDVAAAYDRNLERPTECDGKLRSNSSSAVMMQLISRQSNATLALNLGLSCCSDEIVPILNSHQKALLNLLLFSRQGINGIVTTQYSEPLADTVVFINDTQGINKLVLIYTFI